MNLAKACVKGEEQPVSFSLYCYMPIKKTGANMESATWADFKLFEREG